MLSECSASGLKGIVKAVVVGFFGDDFSYFIHIILDITCCLVYRPRERGYRDDWTPSTTPQITSRGVNLLEVSTVTICFCDNLRKFH